MRKELLYSVHAVQPFCPDNKSLSTLGSRLTVDFSGGHISSALIMLLPILQQLLARNVFHVPREGEAVDAEVPAHLSDDANAVVNVCQDSDECQQHKDG